MENREEGRFESLKQLVLNSLMLVVVIGIAWNLRNSEDWLFWIIDLVVRNQPASFCYLAVGMSWLLAGKVSLEFIDSARVPRQSVDRNLCAIAGIFFILTVLMPAKNGMLSYNSATANEIILQTEKSL